MGWSNAWMLSRKPPQPQSTIDIHVTRKSDQTRTILSRSVHSSAKKEESELQKVLILRHGERVDLVFNSWVLDCFDLEGNYIRNDLNLPRSLPHRKTGAAAFLRDTPITNLGVLQATLTGEALKEVGHRIDHVYCSPSLRCVQTCHSVLLALGVHTKVPIRLEPSLFEWLAWYNDGFPEWMSPDEYIHAGFNIDTDYVPYMSPDDLFRSSETCEQYYNRSYGIMANVLKEHLSGNILFVGHASSIEVCSRQLTGSAPRSSSEMWNLVEDLPYCCMMALQKLKDRWKIVEPPCPSMKHANNVKFDWKPFLTS